MKYRLHPSALILHLCHFAFGQRGQDRVLRLKVAEVSLELALLLAQGIQCRPQRAPFLLLQLGEQLVKGTLVAGDQSATMARCRRSSSCCCLVASHMARRPPHCIPAAYAL